MYESEKNWKKIKIGQEDAKTVKVLLLLQSFIPRGEKKKDPEMYQNMHDCTTLYTIVRFDIN
jgi:hypothetical protein